MGGVLVYRYGLLKPIEQNAAVRDAMFRAHQYRNVLVEVERGRRAAMREAEAAYGNGPALLEAVETAETFVQAALELRNKERMARGNKKDTPEVKEMVRDATDAKKSAVAAWRDYRRSLVDDPRMQAERDRINNLAGDLRRSARSHCNIYWGTYILIEAADEASRKQPLYEGAKPNDPSFVRWQGEGRIGVQLQGGLPSEDAFGSSTLLRIDPVPEEAWHSPTRGVRRKKSRTCLRIRVGSHPDKTPVWAVFPMIMHRPLPQGSTIKNATVSLHKIGPREEWSVQITVALADGFVRRRSVPADGAVSVDLGWRTTQTGIRVATYASTDGTVEHIELPDTWISQLRKADDLRSIRDKNFLATKTSLITSIEGLNLPEWMRRYTATITHWRSPDRMANFVRFWKDRRWVGDQEAYEAAEAWRYQDFHLWQWETSQRKKALRHRREIYRCLAAKLAAKYRTVVLEDFDLRPVVIAKPPAHAVDDTVSTPGARHNRQMSAPSELVGALKNAFADVSIVDGANTTKTCHACGSLEEYNAKENIHHACSSCDAVWDQDVNAAKNLLRRWRERSSDDDGKGGTHPAKSLSKWDKAKELQIKKHQRTRSARKALAKESTSPAE